MTEPESRTFISQRLKLHYVVWGEEHNPPLLLIHGTRDHARSWDAVAERLARNYCVYAPDLRGHGDSGRARGGNYSIIDYALDLHALGERIDRAPYTIVAHSLGGGVALQYAGAFPEKVGRIVSIEGMGGLQWARGRRRPAHIRMRTWVEGMRKLEQRTPRRYPSIEEAAERMLEANSHLTPDLARHLTQHGVEADGDGYVWKFDNYTRAGSPYEFNMEDARDLWNQIQSPILIIWGRDGWGRQGTDFELDLSPFHDVRAVGVEGAGHWVHHDQFELFMGHVEGFLGEGANGAL